MTYRVSPVVDVLERVTTVPVHVTVTVGSSTVREQKRHLKEIAYTKWKTRPRETAHCQEALIRLLAVCDKIRVPQCGVQ